MRRFRLVLMMVSVITVPLAAGGCRGVTLSDDIDIDFNFSLLSGPGDALHLPYVTGTRVVIHANSSAGADHEASFWLESSNSAVLRIDTQQAGRAECTAVGPGEATITVLDRRGGEVVDEGTVEVAIPTRIELHAAGPLMVSHPAISSRLEQDAARIVEQGTATFQVRYFRGSTRLYGNGVLAASGPDTVEIAEESSFLFENREWLQLTPRASGTHLIQLRASGYPVGQLTVHAVPAEAVAWVDLWGEDETAAAEGTVLGVLAQALDPEGRAIFGVDFVWDLDGHTEPGAGDLFYYEYRPGETASVGASFNGRRSAAVVSASEGWVSSSNEIGCCFAGAGGGQALAVPVLLALLGPVVVVVWRRRSCRRSVGLWG